MSDALLSTADLLAEAVRSGLVARGLEADLTLRAADGRVTVVSRGEAVWRAEIGEAGAPPEAAFSDTARAAARNVVADLHDRIRETMR